MQQNDSLRPFDFPYRLSFSSSEHILRLADFDVIGAQGPRLRRLIKLSRDNVFHLSSFEHWVPGLMKASYEQSLKLFLKQFPRTVVTPADGHYEDEFIFRLGIVFPKTMQLIGDYSEKLIADYFADFERSNWLIEDHLSWWPMYVKERFSQKEIAEAAQYEWALGKLDFIDFPIYRKADPGQLYVNPTLQLIKIEAAASTLGKSPGLWIVYRQSDEAEVLEMKLNTQVAQVLDVMAEERKFTLGQLTDWMQTESEFKDLSPSEVLKFLERLVRDSVLVQKIDFN